MKKRSCLLAVATGLACAIPALADSAWVKTERGPLNIRRQPSVRSAIVGHIPNGTMLEVDEAGAQWSRVEYAGTRGYVMTTYLRLGEQMIGKTIYPDGEYLYVREAADENAGSLTALGAAQPMTVLSVQENWAFVSCCGGTVRGYVRLEDITKQREQPEADAASGPGVCLVLSAEEVCVGETVDAFVRSGEEILCQYRLYRDGELIFDGQPVRHCSASYRPRQAGRYRLEVIARDGAGHAMGCEADFDVLENDAAAFERIGGEKVFCAYSQMDGWWEDKAYGSRSLESSGCAIFTLSHALVLMGRDDTQVQPEHLAARYSRYLAGSGTLNSRLLADAAKTFGFITQAGKLTDAEEITGRLRSGAMFSFLVVKGHVALAAGLSGDGTKVRIVDSAPSVTWERIGQTALYYPDGSGGFRMAKTLWDIPGARYYFETDAFGGLEYYLDLSYVANRGVRLIQPEAAPI